MSIHLSWSQPKVGRFALFYLGFRPFFLLASLAAVTLGVLWLLYWAQLITLETAWPSPVTWHGHEMVFGFGMAVIAGFLLTAIRNWTSLQTLHRWPLAVLAGLWLSARLLNFIPHMHIPAAIADLLFGIGLALALTHPILKARQWKQIGLISKVWLLVVANAVSYAQPLHAQTWTLLGLLIIIAILLTMIHRVVPFFIEKAIQINRKQRITLPRLPAVQWLNLPLFLAFTAVWLLWPAHWLQTVLAWTLAAINGYVLLKWIHLEVFKAPLLWSLWGGYAFIVLGFFLAGFADTASVSWLAVHAFGAGAMGLTTLGMMMRVTLGHTGRNVFQPGALAAGVLSMVLIAAVIRVFGSLGLFSSQLHALYLFSLIFWSLGFGLFLIAYLKYWLTPRIDGLYG